MNSGALETTLLGGALLEGAQGACVLCSKDTGCNQHKIDIYYSTVGTQGRGLPLPSTSTFLGMRGLTAWLWLGFSVGRNAVLGSTYAFNAGPTLLL